MLATGGGNATASGVSFQASVAGYFASEGLAETPLDARLGLGAAKPIALRFETEAPVDDILISLDTGGWVFAQAKNSLTNSSSLTSELGKTCDEFARLWETSSTGTGARGWDRPLSSTTDVMVIAVGPTTSGTIKNDLARALDIHRDGSTDTLSTGQKNALESFKKLMKDALAARGGIVAGVDPETILRFVHIVDFDFGGPHRTTAESVLANVLADRSTAPATLAVLEKECERRMAARNGITISGLRGELSRSGVVLHAPTDYRSDVTALRDRSLRVAGALQDFERTQVSGVDITISRACTDACIAAAKTGSLVVVGDPGAGKSAVVNETARRLGSEGSDVLLLAVDRLQAESIEGLSDALGIKHSLAEVLANWPGSGPAYLVLDALDACRFGRSEALFRTVMQEVLEFDQGRWRILASIRTFDLMVGQEFGRLFRGVPPSRDFTDQRFQTTRHIKVPEWSDTEFDELLSKIPALRVAIHNGGPKLAELARVPFNTRLLADLLSSGVAPDKLRDLASQVQLLEMYWNERVRPLGVTAEQCLANTVTAMIDRGRMEATRLAAGSGTGSALDQLLQRGVLTSVNGDREVAFRHHILFDYVASRTVLDLDDAANTEDVLRRKGASLLLAPALSFALQHLWETSGGGRDRFWKAVADLAGAASADPIARSVAARAGCDLPSEAGDTAGLVRLMGTAGENAKAFTAFRHIVGSLSVRLEDDAAAPSAPWCAIASAIVPFVADIAWPLRTLIHNLIERVKDADMRAHLGTASRALMDYAFDARGGESLMPLAIGFVAKTFGTDPALSGELVERLIEPARMAQHAASDMHWLAHDIEQITPHDQALVVEIYDRVFSHTIAEDGPTNLGGSKILALTSNRRQDFKMAQWGLKEAFPAFAASHPLPAAEAAIRVSRGYILRQHPLTEPEEVRSMTIGNQVGRITLDYSYIWAAQHRAQHSDDAIEVIDGLVDMLLRATDTEAIAIADRLIADNEHGWLWNRLLWVANQRRGPLATKMWPWAARTELLRSLDTMKPAIDLLASQYGQRTAAERHDLEARVIAETFPTSNKPEEAALYFQRKVFGAIGVDNLLSQAAKDVVTAAVSAGEAVQNDDAYREFGGQWIERDSHGWLQEKGVDVKSEVNASILEAIGACEHAVLQDDADTELKLSAARELQGTLVAGSTSAHPLIMAYGLEKLPWTIERATVDWKIVSALTDPQCEEIDGIIEYTTATLGSLTLDDSKMSDRARENVAGVILNIVRRAPATANKYEAQIRAFAIDQSSDVRHEVARKVGYFWKADRTLLWELVEGFVANETDERVLVATLSFLIQASSDEPKRIGSLVQTLLSRTNVAKGSGRDTFHEGIGTLVFHLWVRHGQAAAKDVINGWLADRTKFKSELRHGSFSIREGLVLGYDNDDAQDQRTRGRAQSLAFEVIDSAARGLEAYVALPSDQQTDARNTNASDDAALLDTMSDQFFFAVGAPEVRKGEPPHTLGELDYRKRYLDDNYRTFQRVGDVGTPKTVYYMMQLLDFLSPADETKVFDLARHALLNAGKLHGYQNESLAADQLVNMIGRTIADHREVFDDTDRRIALVEVLEAFVDAGWPAARRLLYRLPDALR